MKTAKKSNKKVLPTVLNQYLKADLFKALNTEALLPEERVSLLESVGEVVNKRIIMRLMRKLSDEQKDQLDLILAEHPKEDFALGRFLKSEMPDLQQIINEETAGYKKELIDTFNA
ncbi:MAG: hypothetical protein HYW71_00715 [Candidatus Niyogibacteria bacterium]|nr:hypothetical protein [Candidatus Niyogibacteria bacterium]